MQPLRSGDPVAIGGYRLLRRLGAGGMGTVYLARRPGGALVALKVITAGYAADPGFRRRFRREVAAARGLRGRWLVPVLAADPGAPEPWLATPYVPGPSLAEAVTRYGPLPVASVRMLGARLAEALAEVHAAGLVHRDVKPANILLALDGPRLIDFGIAREAGATTLTAADAVVGTPGYLAPEQARAGGAAVGPAADVFALGCVLAFAAGGRGPFGTGHPAGVVFRTVHEDPELDAVPAELVPLVTACLAKDPDSRPTPDRIRAALTPDEDDGDAPAAGVPGAPTGEGDAPTDPGPHAPPRPGSAGADPSTPAGGGDRPSPHPVAPADGSDRHPRPDVPAQDGDRHPRPHAPVGGEHPITRAGLHDPADGDHARADPEAGPPAGRGPGPGTTAGVPATATDAGGAAPAPVDGSEAGAASPAPEDPGTGVAAAGAESPAADAAASDSGAGGADAARAVPGTWLPPELPRLIAERAAEALALAAAVSETDAPNEHAGAPDRRPGRGPGTDGAEQDGAEPHPAGAGPAGGRSSRRGRAGRDAGAGPAARVRAAVERRRPRGAEAGPAAAAGSGSRSAREAGAGDAGEREPVPEARARRAAEREGDAGGQERARDVGGSAVGRVAGQGPDAHEGAERARAQESGTAADGRRGPAPSTGTDAAPERQRTRGTGAPARPRRAHGDDAGAGGSGVGNRAREPSPDGPPARGRADGSGTWTEPRQGKGRLQDDAAGAGAAAAERARTRDDGTDGDPRRGRAPDTGTDAHGEPARATGTAKAAGATGPPRPTSSTAGSRPPDTDTHTDADADTGRPRPTDADAGEPRRPETNAGGAPRTGGERQDEAARAGGHGHEQVADTGGDPPSGRGWAEEVARTDERRRTQDDETGEPRWWGQEDDPGDTYTWWEEGRADGSGRTSEWGRSDAGTDADSWWGTGWTDDAGPAAERRRGRGADGGRARDDRARGRGGEAQDGWDRGPHGEPRDRWDRERDSRAQERWDQGRDGDEDVAPRSGPAGAGAEAAQGRRGRTRVEGRDGGAARAEGREARARADRRDGRARAEEREGRAPAAGWEGRGGAGRSRRWVLAAGGVVAAGAAGGTWAAMTRPWSAGGPGPHGRRHARPSWTLALHADLGGPGAAVGRAQERGARLAVERHNSRADAAFRLLLRTADDAGDRARAARVAADLVADPSVLAVLGPSWDAAVAEVADVYGKGGVPLLVVSADPGALDLGGLPLVCPTRPAGDLLALPLIHYLGSDGAVRRTAVVEDRTGGTPAWALERRLRAAPSAEGRMTVHRIGSGPSGAEEAARAAVAARAQGLVYTGTSPERAAQLARALRREGFSGPRVAAQYAMEPGFLRGAGAAGTGWVFAAQFADPLALAGPGAREFVRAHRAQYGADPGRWAVEAYDAVGLAATALAEVLGGGAAARGSAGPADADGRGAHRSTRAGARTGAPSAPGGRVPVGVGSLRRALGERVLRTSYQGVAKRLEFAAGSHRPPAASGSYLYRAEPGGYRFLGPYLEVGPGS